jgi:hypothetical protein
MKQNALGPALPVGPACRAGSTADWEFLPGRQDPQQIGQILPGRQDLEQIEEILPGRQDLQAGPTGRKFDGFRLPFAGKAQNARFRLCFWHGVAFQAAQLDSIHQAPVPGLATLLEPTWSLDC